MKLVQSGQARLDRAGLERLVEREVLRDRRPPVEAPRPCARQVGVRSVTRWAEHMEDETNAMLALEHHFNGRSIRDPNLWYGEMLPTSCAFLDEAARVGGEFDLHRDAHVTVAFTAGWQLEPKRGVAVHPVQRAPAGKVAWNVATAAPCGDAHVWTSEVALLDESRPDVAVMLAVARAADQEAVPFLKIHVPTVGRILILRPCGGVGQAAVRDADHARRLAEDAVALVADQQRVASTTSGSQASDVHTFYAAPNALMFFLGQRAHLWGPQCFTNTTSSVLQRPPTHAPDGYRTVR